MVVTSHRVRGNRRRGCANPQQLHWSDKTMSPTDIKTVIASLKVHFERGLEGEQLAERTRSDFPAIASADYVKAA
jgi:hypothetical protein